MAEKGPYSTCVECHAEVILRDLKSGPLWCSTGPQPHTICERSPDHHHHPDEGPESGHTFRVSVTCRGSYGVVGVEGHTDEPEFTGPPMTVEVRAWNLSDALRRAQAVPFAVWAESAEKGS